LNAGAFNFIPKPFAIKQLINAVKKALDSPAFLPKKLGLSIYTTYEINFHIPSDYTLVSGVVYQVLRACESMGFDEYNIKFPITLSITEALVNAIKHGNRENVEKKVKIKALVNNERFEISIEDEGNGFNSNEIQDPISINDIDRENGRGIFLIRHYMDEVYFSKEGNMTTMIKYKHLPE